MPRVGQPITRVPTVATLKRYGITAAEWWAILKRQGMTCAICGKIPPTGFVIDHEHVKGWKKMPPNERKRFIRGVLCRFCNSHCVGRFMTLAKSERLLVYLRFYHGVAHVNA